uniref:Uncharacterized protein n=1 Tax=Acrobeloides nanus TaxID=290746 RepID=A0A914DPU8_9BILA
MNVPKILKRLRFVNQQFNQLIQDYVDHLPRKEIKDTATLSDNSIELSVPEQEFKLAKWGKCWFFRELQVKQLEETIKALKKHATENGPIVACETTFEILSTKEFNLWKTDPQLFDQLITTMDLLS